MCMNKSEALKKIQNSIADGAQLITPKGQMYEEFVDKCSKILIEHVIDPVEATVVSTCCPEGDFEKYRKSKVWAIAHMNDSWLLTIEGENEFALGFGSDKDNILMHGFSSSDALGEWCT